MASSFRKDLKTGFIYTAAAKYSGILISLVVSAILSRLLPPADFGTIAVAMVFIVFFGIFSDMGISSAIIQKRELTKKELNAIFTFTVYVSVFLSAGFFASSWFISKFYGAPKLTFICQILSLNILFATLTIVPNGLLLREKMFKYIGIRTLSIQFILAIFSVIAAFYGAGIYALLINPVGSSILVFFLSYWKFPLHLYKGNCMPAIRKISSYSAYTFAFSLINYFTRNLDKLMIGKIFGMNPLGYYEKSYRLMLLPVQNLTHVITPVLHPALADYQDDLKTQTYKYLHLIKILAIIGFPISAYLFFSAKELIILIFGNQWEPAVPVFKILSLTVGLQICGSTSGSFYQAANKTKELFYIGTANTIINISGLFIGIYVLKSIEGVAWMWTITLFIGLWNNWYFASITCIPVIDTFKPYLPGLISTILVVALLWPINSFMNYSLIFTITANTSLSSLVILFFIQYYKILDIKNFIIRFFKQ